MPILNMFVLQLMNVGPEYSDAPTVITALTPTMMICVYIIFSAKERKSWIY